MGRIFSFMQRAPTEHRCDVALLADGIGTCRTWYCVLPHVALRAAIDPSI